MQNINFENLIDLKEKEKILQSWASDAPVVFADDLVNKFLRKKTNTRLCQSTYLKVFKEKAKGLLHVEKCTLLLYGSDVRNSLSVEDLKLFFDELKERMEQIKIEPGTMVGIIAAQSVGESLTQASLNTFHLSGAKRSITTGITRMKELLNCSSKVPCPYFKVKGANSSMLEKKIKDVAKTFEIIKQSKEKKLSSYQMRIGLVSSKLWPIIKNSSGIPNVILDKLECSKKGILKSNFPSSYGKYDVQKRLGSFLNCRISGVPSAAEIDGDTLFLNRCTLPDFEDFLIENDDLDLNHLETNCIDFIYHRFGIEAVRTYLINEVKKTLAGEGIYVNARHIDIIVDNMTYTGVPTANLYGGINLKENPILKATFQQQTETFAAAAAMNARDDLRDISSQILVGKIPTIGAYSHLVDVVQEKEVVPMEIDNDVPNSPEYAPLTPTSKASDVCDGYIPSSPVPEPGSPVDFIMPDLSI